MDRSNLADLRRIAPDDAARAKLRLLRDFDPTIDGEADVPDPYHGGSHGFEHVFDLVQGSCAVLLDELRAPA
jgi:protein-tyrosine phosphatase